MFKIPANCTGCQACYNICPKKCISMKDNGEGFFYPHIDQKKCIECMKCEKVCPVFNPPLLSSNTKIYAIKNKNENERLNSTSGGFFSVLADYVIDKNGVVFGAVYDDEFKVHHTLATSKEQIKPMQGAKYVQSTIGNTFQMIEKELKCGKLVLFSGTPCQCAGLRNYLGKEYSKLILVDLVCHGIPSLKAWENYIKSRALHENGGIYPKRINMRSKSSGWSMYAYSSEFDYGKGKITHIEFSKDPFLQAFTKDICLRNSCTNCCAKGLERCTDFTLGDYWGVWDQHPEWDDNKGVSLVLVHTEGAKSILELVKNKIKYAKITEDEACKENGSICNSSVPNTNRKQFLIQIETQDIKSVLEYYFPNKKRSINIFGRIKNGFTSLKTVFSSTK